MAGLKAEPGCCEEAALGVPFYAPCNKPALAIVGWKGRRDDPIRMCFACMDHNIKNRGGELIRYLSDTPLSGDLPEERDDNRPAGFDGDEEVPDRSEFVELALDRRTLNALAEAAEHILDPSGEVFVGDAFEKHRVALKQFLENISIHREPEMKATDAWRAKLLVDALDEWDDLAKELRRRAGKRHQHRAFQMAAGDLSSEGPEPDGCVFVDDETGRKIATAARKIIEEELRLLGVKR